MKTLTSRAGTSINTPGNRGFTLIELAMVLAIIVIVFGLIVPRFSGFLGSAELGSTARILAGTARAVHNEAARRGMEIVLHFNLDRNEYWATYKEGKGIDVELGGMLLKKRSLPEGIKFKDIVLHNKYVTSQGEVSLVFSPLGRVGRTVIHLEDKAGKVFTIRIKPYNGQVEVYNYYFDEPLYSYQIGKVFMVGELR